MGLVLKLGKFLFQKYRFSHLRSLVKILILQIKYKQYQYQYRRYNEAFERFGLPNENYTFKLVYLQTKQLHTILDGSEVQYYGLLRSTEWDLQKSTNAGSLSTMAVHSTSSGLR